MKKKVIFVFLIIIVFNALSFNAEAYDIEFFDEQIESSGASELMNKLSDEEKDLLEKVGITDIDFDSVFSASPRRIFDFFFEIIRNEYSSPFNCFVSLLVIVIIMAAVGQFIPEDGENSRAVCFISEIIAALYVIVPLASCVTRAVSAIYVSSNFVTALVPVLAAVITVSGNPTLALTYNSLSFTVAQVIARLGDSVFRPVIQVVFSLSIISSVSDAVNIKAIVEFIKKTVIFLLSFSATVFVTMLTVKGMLAASADSAAVRGIRFLIGNMIPVVGSAVSDAYMSIVGTLGLVKNTVGVFAVAAIAVINLPVLVECILWILMLNILAAVSDLFGQIKLSQLFRCISSSTVLLSVTIIFEILAFVLSVGLILVIKGSS